MVTSSEEYLTDMIDHTAFVLPVKWPSIARKSMFEVCFIVRQASAMTILWRCRYQSLHHR
jgi:hypothetical protein